MQEDNPQSGRANYLDFELEIGQGRGREYPVAVLDSPAGEARATMWFPFDESERKIRLLTLENALLRSGGEPRRTLSPEEQTVQDFGRELFEALFTPDVLNLYAISLHKAAQKRKGLRLKLRIHPPELATLPWEYLYHPSRAEYVSLSTHTPIVRYLEVPQHIQPLTVTPPLRILGMIACPKGVPPLNIDREKQRIENAIRGLQTRGLVNLTWLPGQTWRDLQRAMRQGPWHIFHFIGHGGFDHNTDEGLIVLADEEGKPDYFNATRLGRLLADHPSLRLVLLNSCEGAQGSEHDIFSSTASILIRRGIPAVLAMQYEITDRAAIEFARTFYEALGDGMPVDGATAEARKAISFEVANTVEWGMPVLYMRTPDGVLFQVTGVPSWEPPPSPEPPEEVEAEQKQQLKQLYTAGLSAFRLEEWDKASHHFRTIVESRPGYKDAAEKLAEAQCQLRWNDLYEQAQAAREAEDWQRALSTLQELTAEKPDYRNAAALLAQAEKQVKERRLPWWAMAAIGGLALVAIVVAVVLLIDGLGGETPQVNPTLASSAVVVIDTPTPIPTHTLEPTYTPVPASDEPGGETPQVNPTLAPATVMVADTPTPTSTSTPTDTPLPPPPTPTPCPFVVEGLFSDIWQRYQGQLGCPLGQNNRAPRSISDAEQVFENGHMFWREDNRYHYVVYETGPLAGKYEPFTGWDEEPYTCSYSPPEGKFLTRRGFGWIFCTQLKDPVTTIGWALGPEVGFGPGNGDPLVQDFQYGFIFRDSDGLTQQMAYIFFTASQTFSKEHY